MSAPARIPYTLEHIFSFTALLEKMPEVIGQLPEGMLINFYVTGGDIVGPKLNGKVRPVGGDWFTLRTDGVAIPDVRITFETSDGALIYVTYSGVMDLGADGYQKFLNQQLPATIPLRVTPRFHTASPAYQWLNRLQCIGIGQTDLGRLVINYDVYSVL
ncbi:MAG: DUF3237 domain-containing protein [Blastocatellia bacterium]